MTTSSDGARVLPAERAKAHIRDVARAAGVSHQTVSRVLNNQELVRPETRERVLTAIRDLGYRPSIAARALNNGRTRALGVITFDAARYGPVSILQGISEAAWEHGYLMSTVTLRRLDRRAVLEAIDRLIDQAVDAIIVITSQETVARAVTEVPRDVSMVMVNNTFDDRIPAIGVDEVDGAGLAVRHLLSLGHATVWHLAGPPGWMAAQERAEGWQRSLRQAGANVASPVFGDWTAESGYELGRELASRSELTAVFAANDQMALGLLHALHDAGRSVPRDVSVVGYDDIPEAPHLLPPLSTVRPDFTEIGRRCLATALAQLEQTVSPAPRRILVPARLVIRRSSGPPSR